MKKLILTIAALLAAGSLLFAQEEKEMKTGWSFGILPTATYSVDNGFQAGAFGDVYYYGDGKTYPDPLHKISWEGSYFTHSHRMRLYLAYDSKYLIPNMRVNASATFMTDPLYSFWGFNGAAATQNYDVWGNRDITIPGTTPTNVNYYGMSRQMLRILANFQGRLTDNLNWAAGMNFWNWKIGDMKDNGVKQDDGSTIYYNTQSTLYNYFVNKGVITEAEKNGGSALEINAGLVYDTRDMEAAPNSGIWAEAYLNGNVIGQQYLKACVYFRNYISIPLDIFPAGRPVFAYRLAWQHTIAGETPIYMIQNNPLLVQRNMISEGFGSSNTIRGLRENRILAEGMAWANTELRIKLVKFTVANQYFYVAVNPFFDAGIITKPYKAEALAKIANDEGKIYDPAFDALNVLAGATTTTPIYDASKVKYLVYSGGAGLKIAMNQNFIVSADFAKCFTEGMDAGLWIGIGINYQF
ncbi:MAG: hypothetical protein J5675_06185 [Bacteroidales bacterium]|nr:hypothetical protein [Bacteroidales bacterium]MBO4586174.1 hypothetical protein [Bacteroidales bacterium]